MTNKTEAKSKFNRTQLLVAACAVLVLALIVVSAFAYQWYNEKEDLAMQLSTQSAISDSANYFINQAGEQQMQIQQLTAENEEYQRQIAEYEEILEANELMPE